MTLRNAIVVVLTAGVILIGCYQPVAVTWHAHHEYKGKHDPLLKKYQEADFRTQLEARFRQVQTDR